MFFERISPPPTLASIIECYWVIEDASTISHQQKIIPDGFTEIIFHFADPYRINMNGTWHLQNKALLAGQITKHFFLENTGASSMLGIKLKPTALTRLYGIEMHRLTDTVVPLQTLLPEIYRNLASMIQSDKVYSQKIETLNAFFEAELSKQAVNETSTERAVAIAIEKRGMVRGDELCEVADVGERQLQNLFKQWVGLSPKYFTRILRFSYIFELINESKTWSDLAYEAAFYDQSHFIRNFKQFTGESPTDYAFDEKNMANFFLKKT